MVREKQPVPFIKIQASRLAMESSFDMIYDDGLVTVSNPFGYKGYRALARLARSAKKEILFPF